MTKAIWCVGIATLDHIFGLDALPSRAVKYRAQSFKAAGGGVAANAAVAIARLGGQVSLLARLGDDAIGAAIVAQLRACGVDCRNARHFAGCVSPVSAILVDAAGERIIVNYLDPALPDEPSWLPGTIPDDVAVVLADTRWVAGSLAMLNRARALGRIALLDGDMPGCPPELVAAATLVAFSAEGLRLVTGVSDLRDGLFRAATIGDGMMMVTDGANGAFWLESGILRHCPAFGVKVVDTLGAGDVFHGALAVALAESASLAEAVRFASAAAAIKVTRFGGRNGAPLRAEVETFLQQNKE